MEILMDASVIMAIIVREPERDMIIQLTQDAVLISPSMVSYEIANALTNEIIVNSKNGKRYQILPVHNDIKNGKSPIEDIPYIIVDITTQEIVELIRESRSGI